MGNLDQTDFSHREFVPRGVERRQRKGVCTYYDVDMPHEECPECGSDLTKYKTSNIRAPNYWVCEECEKVIDQGRPHVK